MEKRYITEAMMLPMIRLARLFDTRQEGIWRPTKTRVIAEYEIGIYLGDSGRLTVNQQTYEIRKGDIRFLRPGDEACSEPHYQCYTVFFSFGEEPVAYYNEFLDAIPTYISPGSEQIRQFERLIKLFTSEVRGSHVSQNALLLKLLADIHSQQYAPGRLNPVVQQSIVYMQENLEKKITLECLGELTSYSPLHVLRLFKQHMQQTPHELLHEMRLTKAKELLNNTGIPISKIAGLCGYHSESHFQTLFKQANGMTPGTYRKNAKILL